MKRIARPLGMFLLASACATHIPPPQTAAAPRPDAEKAWASHLSRFVDEKGRMDYAGMAKDPADLNTYLAYVAKVSPASQPDQFSTPESKLAYYINTYNALAMYDVLKSNFPPNLNDVKVTFFYKNRFEVGGQFISLYALENQVIRPMGDPRVHVALNCMARGCPRLPREPFTAAELDRQLDRQAKEFFNETRNVELQPDKQTVRFSQILQFYTGDFLKKVPTLIAYANMYRGEKIPADWKVDFIPYDWVLNKQ
ncbi:MAG TPA: DUF547 domain-containing protein [Thermoanaerobaculia bacterium]